MAWTVEISSFAEKQLRKLDRPVQQRLPVHGRHDVTALAAEQGHPQSFLEFADTARKRRLRNVRRAGRPVKIAVLPQGQGVGQLLQCDHDT